MKGWRPSAWLKLENRFGLGEAGEFLPDVGSIGLSFPQGPSWAPGSLLALNEAPRPAGRTKSARASAILKTAPALHLLQRAEDPEMKTEGTINQGRTGVAGVARGLV